ncbi:nucleoid-associated protein, partial [Pseudomonas aeruginosa]
HTDNELIFGFSGHGHSPIDFIGCQEGIDSPGETRTLLKAFSDFVESEGMAEQQAREKTETLVDYATSQARIGE